MRRELLLLTIKRRSKRKELCSESKPLMVWNLVQLNKTVLKADIWTLMIAMLPTLLIANSVLCGKVLALLQLKKMVATHLLTTSLNSQVALKTLKKDPRLRISGPLLVVNLNTARLRRATMSILTLSLVFSLALIAPATSSAKKLSILPKKTLSTLMLWCLIAGTLSIFGSVQNQTNLRSTVLERLLKNILMVLLMAVAKNILTLMRSMLVTNQFNSLFSSFSGNPSLPRNGLKLIQ